MIMKFSTIVKKDNSYQIFPGATFELELNSARAQSRISRSGYGSYGRERYYSSSVPISNELLVSPDAFVRHHVEHGSEGKYPFSRYEITLVKAALRLGNDPVFVPESDAARCEIQRRAHAVLIADSRLEAAPAPDTKVAGKMLMWNFAVMAEGDVLDLKIVERGTEGGGIFKAGTPYENVIEHCQLTFDGTNLQLTGAPVEHLSQECFV
jgi:hypothetical protein